MHCRTVSDVRTVSVDLASSILRKQLSTTYWRDPIWDLLTGHTSMLYWQLFSLYKFNYYLLILLPSLWMTILEDKNQPITVTHLLQVLGSSLLSAELSCTRPTCTVSHRHIGITHSSTCRPTGYSKISMDGAIGNKIKTFAKHTNFVMSCRSTHQAHWLVTTFNTK